ncbi:hypothetical protein ACT3SP_15015 [Brachybacterium sp. AOP43-C2-M15]|uniref:hypothetical protein n=1 Tax=Brachybacterium sp. AOP43-C2-M15 TaxID=3457661 RepID=UPI00403491E8
MPVRPAAPHPSPSGDRRSRTRALPPRTAAAAAALAVVAGGLTGLDRATAEPGPEEVPSCSVSTSRSIARGEVPLVATTSTTAAGVQFFLDGEPLGFGFTPDAGPGTRFDLAVYGTLDGGWSTHAVDNGDHELSCRAWSEAGLGEAGDAHEVVVRNGLQATLSAPSDQVEVGGEVEVVAEFTGHRLPEEATFRMDDEVLGTGECTRSGTRATCTYLWDSESTTDLNHWDMVGGLRVLSAEAEVAGATVSTQPVRSIVNNRPGAELILSAYELEGLGRVGRDGGWSVAMPGDPDKHFVTFGDGIYRPITGPQKAEDAVGRWGNSNVVTTAGTGMYDLFHEIPNTTNDPFNAPPETAIKPEHGVLKAEDGSDCAEDKTLAWSTGVVAKPNSDNLLLTYWGMCSRDGDWPSLQVYGVADWDLDSGTVEMHDVFVQAPDLPSQMQLSSPSTDGEYLYFWRPDVGAHYLARVKIPTEGDDEPWTDPAQYEYRNSAVPGGWVADPMQAENLMPESSLEGNTYSILRATNLPGEPWLLITQPSTWDTGTISVYLADEPGDPWREVPELQDVTVCEPCGNTWDDGVYVVYSHPERSTDTEMLITFTDRSSSRVLQKILPIPESMRQG